MYVADLLDAMTVLGPKLAQIYGQGEAPMTITGMDKGMHIDDGHPRYRERIGSAGVVRTDVEVRVVDADANPLPPGEIGEIGRAHVWTPATNAQIICRLLLEHKK